MNLIEWIRIVFIGIVEGITEWLPISSTGHMILVNEIWKTKVPNIITNEFWTMFEVVIQLGAILAVVTIYFNKLNPFSPKKTKDEKKESVNIWFKTIVGCIPAGIAGVLLDDWMDEHLYNGYVVATMLILYGILFIVIENRNKKKDDSFRINDLQDLDYKTALGIGIIQILSLVPGTSRSGVTIIGGMLLGTSRLVATEYTFFLGIPIMFGASFIKILKFLIRGDGFSGLQISILIVGVLVAYVVSMFAIRFLINYIKKNDFKIFGVYRIALGILVLAYFILR